MREIIRMMLAENSRLSAQSTKKDESVMLASIQQIMSISGEVEERAEAVNNAIANITAILQETSAKSEEIYHTAHLLLEEQHDRLKKMRMKMKNR